MNVNKKLIILIITIIIVSLAVFNILLFKSDKTDKQSNVINKKWEQATKEKKFILLYFYTDWCRTCKKIGPTIDILAKENRSKYMYIKINADDKQNRDLAMRFRLHKLPTIYLINPRENIIYDMPLYSEIKYFDKDLKFFLTYKAPKKAADKPETKEK